MLLDNRNINTMVEAIQNIEAFKQYAPNPATIEARRADYLMYLLAMKSTGFFKTDQEINEVKVIVDMLHDKLQKVLANGNS